MVNNIYVPCRERERDHITSHINVANCGNTPL